MKRKATKSTHAPTPDGPTPGPWTLDEVWMLIKGPNGEEVAAIHTGAVGEQRQTRNIAWANAMLIISAPGMAQELATVKADKADLVKALDEIESLPVDDEGNRTIPPLFLDTARKLIAKHFTTCKPSR